MIVDCVGRLCDDDYVSIIIPISIYTDANLIDTTPDFWWVNPVVPFTLPAGEPPPYWYAEEALSYVRYQPGAVGYENSTMPEAAMVVMMGQRDHNMLMAFAALDSRAFSRPDLRSFPENVRLMYSESGDAYGGLPRSVHELYADDAYLSTGGSDMRPEEEYFGRMSLSSRPIAFGFRGGDLGPGESLVFDQVDAMSREVLDDVFTDLGAMTIVSPIYVLGGPAGRVLVKVDGELGVLSCSFSLFARRVGADVRSWQSLGTSSVAESRGVSMCEVEVDTTLFETSRSQLKVTGVASDGSVYNDQRPVYVNNEGLRFCSSQGMGMGMGMGVVGAGGSASAGVGASGVLTLDLLSESQQLYVSPWLCGYAQNESLWSTWNVSVTLELDEGSSVRSVSLNATLMDAAPATDEADGAVEAAEGTGPGSGSLMYVVDVPDLSAYGVDLSSLVTLVVITQSMRENDSRVYLTSDQREVLLEAIDRAYDPLSSRCVTGSRRGGWVYYSPEDGDCGLDHVNLLAKYVHLGVHYSGTIGADDEVTAHFTAPGGPRPNDMSTNGIGIRCDFDRDGFENKYCIGDLSTCGMPYDQFKRIKPVDLGDGVWNVTHPGYAGDFVEQSFVFEGGYDSVVLCIAL